MLLHSVLRDKLCAKNGFCLISSEKNPPEMTKVIFLKDAPSITQSYGESGIKHGVSRPAYILVFFGSVLYGIGYSGIAPDFAPYETV
jgi:hypothetical protein